MIQLTLHPNHQPETITFFKKVIVIGSGAPGETDVYLPEENLQPVHVKIIEQDGQCAIINVANDPFVTLNALPFSKKQLHNHDIIQIGQTILEFQQSEEHAEFQNSAIEHSWTTQDSRIHEALDRTIANAHDDLTPQDDALSEDEIDDLMREVESLTETSSASDNFISFKEPSPTSTKEPIASDFSDELPPQTIFKPIEISPHPVHIEAYSNDDSHIRESDDDSYLEPEQKSDPKIIARNWNIFFFLLAAVLTVTAIIFAGIYINISDRSDDEKITAAESVADVAMALAYAQVYHIKPQKQNWSDPEFLKNNLASVLSAEYPPFANIDNQGQFTNCSYILRIYTSSDLSQFLVIAQPEPSLSQWLIHKTAIIVDSRAMEMRTINDLKALNRLLLNPNNLDGTNATEISQLIKQGDLIPLTDLAAKRDDPGFAPPKALALIRPGAENLIYNAPRYFHFGESVLMRATSMLQNAGNSFEVGRLKQELTELSKLPDIVLYSAQGLQKAFQAQKALSTIAPGNKLLTGYLNINEKGVLTSSQLLLNDDSPLGEAISTKIEKDAPAHTPTITAPTAEINIAATPALKFDGGIDRNHPLLLNMIALANARQQALKPLSDQMIELLNSNTDGITTNFTTRYASLWNQYTKLDAQQSEKAIDILKELYQQNADMPLAQFTAFVKAAQLDQLAKSSLASYAKESVDSQVTPEQVAAQMNKIHFSKDFVSLESAVKDTVAMLSLEHLPDAYQLIYFQNQMRDVTLSRLRKLILSAASPVPDYEFNDANRIVLLNILQAAWVNDSDEHNFYLTEFEHRRKGAGGRAD